MSIRSEMTELLESLATQVHLNISTSSEGGTAEELLKKTDNGSQADSGKLSWGSTGRANPNGYCQHATGLADANHLSHKNDFTVSL